MGWFKKKREDEEDMEEEDVEEEDTEEETQASPVHPGASMDANVVADVERLKAQVEASKEIRAVFNEKISRLREDFGQIRNMLSEQEKQLEEVELKATKSADLVAEVQPQQIYMEAKKSESKIEALKAKIESIELVNQKMMEEMKSMREEVKKARTLKQTFELNQDVRKEIMIVKKNVAKADGAVSKIQEMYMQTQKRFAEFEKYKQQAVKIEENYLKTKEDVDKIMLRTNEVITQTDLDNATASIIDNFNDMVEKVDQKLMQLTEFKTLLNKYDKLVAKRDTDITWLHKETKKIASIIKDMSSLKQKVAKNHSDLIKEKQTLNKKINKMSQKSKKK